MSKDPFQDINTNNDPFDDIEPTPIDTTEPSHDVHIRIQQRNGKKCVTIVQDLPPKLDTNKVIKFLKKKLNCNGTIVEDETAGKVIQLTGDQRKAVHDFLIEQKICSKDHVKIHGVL